MLATLLALAAVGCVRAAEPLQLETKIALGEVKGRIDHLAIDLAGKRLFVAELGNDSIGIVDLSAGKFAQRISGLAEPQGVGYEPNSAMIYVANAGDGSLRLFDGQSLQPAGRIDLGDDADNIRIDAAHRRVVVGYGGGALAVIDPASRQRIAEIRVKAHPEGFQLDPDGSKAYVNIPDVRQVAVLDLAASKQIGGWEAPGNRANFPMALDMETKRVLAVYRSPPRLIAFDAATGRKAADVATCEDADDVFVDQKRRHVYVSCGEGIVESFAIEGGGYRSDGRIKTVSGARTSLFVAELDRLYLAVRARSGEPAAIWVFRTSS
jgi:hypothetical protein